MNNRIHKENIFFLGTHRCFQEAIASLLLDPEKGNFVVEKVAKIRGKDTRLSLLLLKIVFYQQYKLITVHMMKGKK